MAILKLSLIENRRLQLLSTFELDSSRDYVAGRSEDCEIVLPDQRGISRQHFKLTASDGAWNLTVLSRYGELYYQEKKVAELRLESEVEFSIPPLHFHFFPENHLAPQEPLTMTPIFEPAESAPSPVFSLAPDEERTFVGMLPQSCYLRLYNHNDEVLQVYRLEGENWIAGRDTSSAIFIDHERISRRQFEIKKQEQLYFIRDLKSSNGTSLNGQVISPVDWSPLASGDMIRVGDFYLKFELRDAQYEERLQQAQQLSHMPLSYSGGPQVSDHNDLANFVSPANRDFGPPPKQGLSKKNMFRLAALGILGVAVVVSLLDDGDSSNSKSPRNPAGDKMNKNALDFSRLKPEQQEFVRQTHRLSKELLMQGRYEMARQEILKIHQFVAVFEDSLEIENTSVQGIQLQQEKVRAEAKEREKIEVEEKINRQLQTCRARIHPKIQAEEMDNCLAPVIQFNPEHSGILALKSKVDQMVADRNIRDAQRADYSSQVARQAALYKKATNLSHSGQLLQAIKAFDVVVDSRLPDPQDLKTKARREIASLQQSLASRQAELESKADENFKKGDLKQAIVDLQKAVKINPENEVTKGKVTVMINELRKQMQTLYQEGILEESVGDVESAKVKWKKIINLSLPEEEYYKKSTIKLKKYGAL